MGFSRLPGGQKASLMFIVGAMVSTKTPPALKKLIDKKDWHTLAIILSMGTSSGVTVPSEDDLRAVGEMAPGLRNANLVLAMADAEPNEDSKAELKKALDTHCWDKVAETLVDSMKDKTDLPFTGGDLHQAYAPEDGAPCAGPSGFEVALAKTIAAGRLAGVFFSKSLPDFFEQDFAGFFKDTLPDFFGGPFSEFFADLGNNIQGGFVDFGKSVQDAFESFGQIMDTSRW